MILPYTETIEIGHGYSVDIEITDLGPGAVPPFAASWDYSVDFPSLKLVAYYPIELLGKIDATLSLQWRVEDFGPPVGTALCSSWGTVPIIPNTRAATHRYGDATVKTDNVVATVAVLRKSIITAVARIKSYLDTRAARLTTRENIIQKARAEIDTTSNGKTTGERFTLLELS